MKVWVTRDKSLGCDVTLWRGTDIPMLYENGIYDCPVTTRTCKPVDMLEDIEPAAFKELFGFTPKKGTCKQYELSLKEIE